jgi:Predicted periplasmic protein (DUF2092)
MRTREIIERALWALLFRAAMLSSVSAKAAGARDKLDIVALAGDLIYANAFDILMQDVTSGFVVGKGTVDGVRCDHLAFRSAHVDWQIWIQGRGAAAAPQARHHLEGCRRHAAVFRGDDQVGAGTRCIPPTSGLVSG